jgi:hypothetical protein
MALSVSELNLLNALVSDENVAFTAADRDAYVQAGVPIFCILAAGARLITCGGPTDPNCLAQFITDVAACFS